MHGVWAGKSGVAGRKAGSGQLGRAASSRKTARSDYEEQRIMLQLQAVERMKEMVQARPLTQAPSLHPPCQHRICLPYTMGSIPIFGCSLKCLRA